MNLQQFCDQLGINPGKHFFNRIVPHNPQEKQLWYLEDYKVSSVRGGSIWLFPKWNSDKITLRNNIRNFLLTATTEEKIQEIRISIKNNDRFRAMCILEAFDPEEMPFEFQNFCLE